MCLTHYKLDPCHYYSAPGLAWDAMLKMTRVQLQLITDIEMSLMIEKSVRGGMTNISHRYARSNNGHQHDPSLPTSHILYLDMNSEYSSVSLCYMLNLIF